MCVWNLAGAVTKEKKREEEPKINLKAVEVCGMVYDRFW